MNITCVCTNSLQRHRERNQHSPTCQWLAFSHNSISTLVKQRRVRSHGPVWSGISALQTHTFQSDCANLTDPGKSLPVSAWWTSGGSWRMCKKWKVIQTTGNHRSHSHSWQAEKSFQCLTIQTQSEKMTSHCVPAKYLCSFTLSYTHSSFPPPSISRSYIMAFCQWI